MPATTTKITVVKQILTPTTRFPTIPTQSIQIVKKTENLDLSTHPVRHVVKLTILQRNVILEQTQLKDRLPEIDDRNDRFRSKQFRCKCPSCIRNFILQTPRLHSVATCDRPETIKTAKLLPVLEVVWHQHPEIFTDPNNLIITNNDTTKECTQETPKTTVASQTLLPKWNQPQNYLIVTEQHPGNQLGSESVPFLSCFNNCPTDIQESEP